MLTFIMLFFILLCYSLFAIYGVHFSLGLVDILTN